MAHFFSAILGLLTVASLGYYFYLKTRKEDKAEDGDITEAENENYINIDEKSMRLIALAVAAISFFLCIIVYPMGKDDEAEKVAQTTTTTSTAAKNTATKEKSTAKEKPAAKKAVNNPTMNVDADTFKKRFNEYLHTQGGEIGSSRKLDLMNGAKDSAGGQHTITFKFDELGVEVQENIDYDSKKLKEVLILAKTPGMSSDEAAVALLAASLAYNASIYATDTSVSRIEIQQKLGLDSQDLSELVKDSNYTQNNIRYSKGTIKGKGMAFRITAL